MARPARRPGNLPAEATSFIGHRDALVDVRTKLSANRLVSLVGPGGVGKTRLGIRAGTDLARGFPDGAWLVELADVRDSRLLSNALMLGLDLRDQSAADPHGLVLAYLHDKQLLLLVDNCEHLLPASAQLVAEVLRAAPGVRVIATSREPLSVDGEQVVPVPPLQLPPAQQAEPLTRLRQNEAVMLLVERAAAASGAFELTESNRSAVVEVCRRLDGLPLAIELAAVRTRVLTAEQIRDRLNDRFGLLTGGRTAALPRHQTLRTTIEWSYDLLDHHERALLARLAVFAGQFSLEDVEAVCTSDDVPTARALDVLSSLVEKSLVIKENVKAVAGFRLHETMREFARLKLREAGEELRLEDRATDYFRSTIRAAVDQSRYRLPAWLEWIDLEMDNIRAVLGRCLAQRDSVRGIDLVTALGWYWITRATTEGVRWLDDLLATGAGQPEAQFWAYFLRGFLAALKSDAVAAGPAIGQALTAARALEQPMLLSQALSMASIASNIAGDRESALRMLNEAQIVTRSLDDYPARISVLQAQALNGFFSGDIEAVKRASTEGIALSRDVGDLYSLEMMLLNRGGTALMVGEFELARTDYIDALKIAQRIDDRVAQYALLDELACVAAASGKARLAAQLLGAAETIRTQAGASLIPILAPLLAQAEASATAALGASKFEAEVNAGKRLSRDEAIRLALEEPAPVAASTATDGQSTALLGKREVEVARLVAEGRSNKQIGAKLFISERTVDSHVRSILNKLGFNSRAQIAGWIASNR